DIGAATVCGTLRFDDEKTIVEVKGKKLIGENVAFIGDYCRTGVNAILMPGVRVGPYSIVGPGVILYEDLEPYKIVLAKQELVKKDWGPNKYGW
ncbi:MAG: nucleoside-diphosphate-sugar pyrophosphorylase, partial [Thermoproteota archaeon]